MKQTIIELMPDETIHTTEGRVGRAMVLSPLMRLYRKGAIDAETFRVGQCLTMDLAMLLGSSSWAAMGETIGVRVDEVSRSHKGVASSAVDAANRVRRCQKAVGFREQFLTLTGLLEGFGTEELDRLWQRRRNARQSQIVCINALALIVEAKVYETLKHQPSVWAAAAA